MSTPLGPLSNGRVYSKNLIYPHRNSFLHRILKDDNVPLSQVKGILPLITESLFARRLRPTFVEFDFKITKFLCLEVKV